jgi:hypothetical protein
LSLIGWNAVDVVPKLDGLARVRQQWRQMRCVEEAPRPIPVLLTTRGRCEENERDTRRNPEKAADRCGKPMPAADWMLVLTGVS